MQTIVKKLPFVSQLKDDPEAIFNCCVWRFDYNACECCCGGEDLSGGSHEFYGDDDPNAPVFCKAHWDQLHDEKTGQSRLIPIE